LISYCEASKQREKKEERGTKVEIVDREIVAERRNLLNEMDSMVADIFGSLRIALFEF
jgi:hypothetical protein